MMTVNNFYAPKIYDVSHQNLKEIEIWFNDACGNQIPIRQVHQASQGSLEVEIYQAAFKLECELAIVK
jgi:hypothetical protein